MISQSCRVLIHFTFTMTARLQSATHSGHPILARFISVSGHGMGTALSEKIAQKADVLAFLFDQLGTPSKYSHSPP